MILYRYIIKELIFPFLVSICIISFFFVMQQAVLLAERIISKGIDLRIVLEIFAVQLGWIVVLAVPMAILLATLWTFGRMSGDNEITSIKASGQNPITLLIPVLAAATVSTILIYFVNDLILPDANHRTANLFSDIARKKPAALIEPRILICDYPGYAIYIDDVDPRTGLLKDIRIFTDSPDQDPSTTIADSGLIQITPDQKYIRLSLFNGETHSIPKTGKDDYFVGRFGKQVICIKNIETDLQRTSSNYRGDREKTTAMMYTDIADVKKSNAELYNEFNQSLDSLKNRIHIMDSLSLAHKESVQNSGDSLTFVQWVAQLGADKRIPIIKVGDQKNLIDRVTRRLYSNSLIIAQYTVEVHKKYAMPAACIIFALIGAPLGIMARRGGLTVGATYSIVFFIVNWLCLIGGESLADKGKLNPVLAMWSGNIITGIVAIVLIILMLRDRTIRFDAIPNFFKRLFPKIKLPRNRITSLVFQKIPGVIFWTPRWISRKLIGTLPTYLMGSFLKITTGLMLAILAIFVFMDYVGNLKRYEGMNFQTLLVYYWYYLPWIILIILPIVLLLSSMFSIGQMAKNSELTAMKASGINIRQISLSLLILGIALSVGAFYGGEKILPHTNLIRREMMDTKGLVKAEKKSDGVTKEFRRNFYYFADPKVVYFFDEFSTIPQYARSVVRQIFSNNKIMYRLEAEQMIYDSTGWNFSNGTIRDFSDTVTKISSFVTLKDTILTAAPVQMVARIKNKEEMSYWELKKFMEAARKRGENIQKFMGELDFKIALPFMNFIVILLGVAITARTGKKGGAVLFGIGLVMCLMYWIISRIAIVIAQNGHMPTLLGAWIGNLIFFVIGVVLYGRATR